MAKKTNLDHTELLVLSLLAQEDMYGYQMIAELARQSDHTFEMKEGTLYPVLHTLEHGGAVSSYRAAATAGKERKYYHLTKKGLELLQEERDQWRKYAGAVESVLQSVPDPA